MSRPILPFPPSYGSSPQPFHLPQPDPPPPPPPPPTSKPTYAKRGRITIVACLPCRRRKTKCDGKRPSCSQCLGRDGQCQYDMTDEQRRLTFLRENVEHLEREKSELESLLLTLQRSSEDDVAEVMRILRTGSDLHTIARQAYAGRLLSKVRSSPPRDSSSSGYTNAPSVLRPAPQLEQYQSLIRNIASASPAELDEIVRRLRFGSDPGSILAAITAGTLLQGPLPARDQAGTPGVEAEFSGREQFGLVKGAGDSMSQDASRYADDKPDNNHWTSVTDDHDWVEHLLSLYFAWQHLFFQNFPEQCFRAGMASGRTEYCSKLLVNAICAAGCLFSSSERVRRDPHDARTAGLDFYEEAIRLLDGERESTLPTTAALSILSNIESNFSRLSSQWQYSGRSSRMALDMNLHLRSSNVPTDRHGPGANLDVTARAHVFWGCFISDQVTSFTLGRLPLIPTNAITVEIPALDLEQDEVKWVADGVSRPRKSASSTTFRQIITLSKMVNSTLQMFFAPSQSISGSLLLEEYNKYRQWYTKLSPAVASIDDAPPHVLSLHMYYHAAVLLLFRPFLKAKFTDSDVSPRDMCRQSANKISDLFARHRQLYGLDGIFTFQVHCLLSACTIHIIKLPAVQAISHLAAACNSFQDLVGLNEWATGSLNIIRELVQKWQIVLPLEVEAALYRDQDATALAASGVSEFELDFGSSSSGNPVESSTPPFSAASTSTLATLASSSRPEKRDAPFPNPIPGQIIPKRQKLTVPSDGLPHSLKDSSQIPSTSSSVSTKASTSTTATHMSHGRSRQHTHHHHHQTHVNYLFAPVPYQSAPLLRPVHTSSPMDDSTWNDEINSALSQGFDGLNFMGDDGFDPFMGYRGD